MTKRRAERFPEIRRFRRNLECGHKIYVTTVHTGPPSDIGGTPPSLLCDVCYDFRQVVDTVEVPAIPESRDCPRCKEATQPREVADDDTDHPRVGFRCVNGHSWDLQL